jgi:hypothetical protein
MSKRILDRAVLLEAAAAFREMYPGHVVYVGGHHIAAWREGSPFGSRLLFGVDEPFNVSVQDVDLACPCGWPTALGGLACIEDHEIPKGNGAILTLYANVTAFNPVPAKTPRFIRTPLCVECGTAPATTPNGRCEPCEACIAAPAQR